MLDTLSDPINKPKSKFGISQSAASDVVELYPNASEADLEIVIRAIYKQVLGNAYVMESERLVALESQLKGGELSVREFTRSVAKSELYRSRFFDNCYRYRAIELNFKHLLGRAPDTFEEMRYHSSVLDQGGHDAEIDSYLDSNEYQNAFGETIVPFYRGYTSQLGQSMLGYTNMLQLMRSASSSDKDLKSGNRPRVQRSLILNSPFGKAKTTDVSQLLADMFQSKVSQPSPSTSYTAPTAPTYSPQPPTPTYSPQPTYPTNDQARQIAALQQQLAELRPFANIGAAIVSKGQINSAAEPSFTARQPAKTQAEQIADLQSQLIEARAQASIGEYRLNKWRSRTFS
jgi:phycoerythrin-associated linker protein